MNMNRAYMKTADFLARQLKLNFAKAKAAPAVLAKHMMKAAAQLIDRSHNRSRKMRPAQFAAKQSALALLDFFGYSEAQAMIRAFAEAMQTADKRKQRRLI